MENRRYGECGGSVALADSVDFGQDIGTEMMAEKRIKQTQARQELIREFREKNRRRCLLEKQRGELMAQKTELAEELRRQFRRTNSEHVRCDRTWEKYVRIRNFNADAIEALWQKVLEETRLAQEAFSKAEMARRQGRLDAVALLVKGVEIHATEAKRLRAEIEEIKQAGLEARVWAEETAAEVSEVGLKLARRKLASVKAALAEVDAKLASL